MKSQEEIDFYKNQISLMEERYEILFLKNKISWNKYYDFALKKLNFNLYYVWIFLCGLETFIKSHNFEIKDKESLIKNLYKDAENRIYRILGDSRKVDEYIRSINTSTS